MQPWEVLPKSRQMYAHIILQKSLVVISVCMSSEADIAFMIKMLPK